MTTSTTAQVQRFLTCRRLVGYHKSDRDFISRYLQILTPSFSANNSSTVHVLSNFRPSSAPLPSEYYQLQQATCPCNQAPSGRRCPQKLTKVDRTLSVDGLHTEAVTVYLIKGILFTLPRSTPCRARTPTLALES